MVVLTENRTNYYELYFGDQRSSNRTIFWKQEKTLFLMGKKKMTTIIFNGTYGHPN